MRKFIISALFAVFASVAFSQSIGSTTASTPSESDQIFNFKTQAGTTARLTRKTTLGEILALKANVRDTNFIPSSGSTWRNGNFYRLTGTSYMYFYGMNGTRLDFENSNGAVLSSFNTNIAFNGNKYLSSQTVADSIVFTADTTAGSYGNFTVARLNFGTGAKKRIRFSGGQFDTLQRYSIGNPDSLSGLHMVYFEKTPYGVAVSVPTNATYASSNTSTTTSDSSAIPSPFAAAAGNLLAEFDAKTIKWGADTVRWTDKSAFRRYAHSTVSARKPTPYVVGQDTLGANIGGATNHKVFKIRDSIQFTATSPFSITFVVRNLVQKAYFVTDFYINNVYYLYRPAMNYHGFTGIESVGTGTAAVISGYAVIQMVSDGTTVKYYVNNVQVGTDKTRNGTGSKFLSWIGHYSDYHTEGTDDSQLLYFSCNQAAYSNTQRQNLFSYLNWKYNLGL